MIATPFARRRCSLDFFGRSRTSVGTSASHFQKDLVAAAWNAKKNVDDPTYEWITASGGE